MERKSLAEIVAREGSIVVLEFSLWPGKVKLRPDELGISVIDREKIFLGQKRLIDKKAFDDLWYIYNKSWRFLKLTSFDFPIGAARFVPRNMVESVVLTLRMYKEEFNAAVEQFIDLYPKRKSLMLEAYKEMFKEFSNKNELLSRLESEYISEADLRRKFRMNILVFDVSPLKLVEEEFSRKLEEFLHAAIASLQERLYDVISRLRRRLEGENITLRTVTSVRRFVQSFKDLDFMDLRLDSELQKLVDTLQAGLIIKDFSGIEREIDRIEKLVNTINSTELVEKYKRRRIM